MILDRASLLADVDTEATLGDVERWLHGEGLTLRVDADASLTVGAWLEAGARGAPDAWADPADHLLAGLEAVLPDGSELSIRPAPRRAVGPDLATLFVGQSGRFGRLRRVWVRVHPRGVPAALTAPFLAPRDPDVTAGEAALLDDIARELGAGNG